MKRRFTIFCTILMVCVASLSFGSPDSKLHLNLFSDGEFVVHVDEIRYPNVRGNFDVGGLYAGTHRIRIVEVFQNQGRGRRNQGREVLYNGTINIPFRSAVFAKLTPNLGLRIIEVKALPSQRQDNSYRNRRKDNRNYRGNSSCRHRGENQHGIPRIQDEMNYVAFDKERLRLAKNFVANHGAHSEDVAELMLLFTFEKNKLEFAKFAFGHVCDPDNFRAVNRSFTFRNSIRELERHTSSRHRH
jgi:hypothetical protein